MTDRDHASPRRSAFALARQLIGGFVTLARLELTHGRQEVGAMLATARGGLVLIGIAIALVLAAVISLTVFLILALAALIGWPGWVMSLIVTLLLLVAAGVLAWRAYLRIKALGPPEETIASVKEEVAWAKRLIRRG